MLAAFAIYSEFHL